MSVEKLYVLGHPVAHSKSPAMHNAVYRALGLEWRYGLMDCPDQAAARAFLEARDWRACNVTMPYKPLALQLAGERSRAACLAGGANVLVNWEGRLHADNTDGKGCVSYLKRCGVDFAGARVCVCGTGPTSLAIMHACAEAGASRITLFGRDLGKVGQALDRYAEQAGARVELAAAAYDPAGDDDMAAASVIIDATPLGMHEGDPAPFNTSVLAAGQTVFDVVYGHGTTQLVADARKAGCSALDGAGMLVAQAVETMQDIADVTGAFSIPAHVDLFAVMADAAGFAV